MIPYRALICLLLALLLLSGCSHISGEPLPAEPTQTLPAPTQPSSATVPAVTDSEPSPEPLPEQILAGMTLREKVGQLFLVRPDTMTLSWTPVDMIYSYATGGVTGVSDAMREALELYPVGGFILFSRNISDPDQLSSFNRDLRDACAIPPFLAVDEEGGAVARLANNRSFGLPRYSSAFDVFASGGIPAVQDMGIQIGGYLSEDGFNMDMAPDADVFTNPNNTVIGHRAFSSDPREAAASARAMADGLRQRGICPVFKHFPGHGDTAEDSHHQIAVSYKSLEELEACEWIPFLEAEDRECIMVGHVALPEITGSSVPATLSPRILQDFLRGTVGFEGLILTDSLSMGAITAFYDPDLAPLMALEAGCDVLLMPEDLPASFETIVDAVESGALPESRVDESVLKILRFKEDYHLLDSYQ